MSNFVRAEIDFGTSEKNTLIHSVQSGHLTYKMILTKSTLLIESNKANSTENPREKKINIQNVLRTSKVMARKIIFCAEIHFGKN